MGVFFKPKWQTKNQLIQNKDAKKLYPVGKELSLQFGTERCSGSTAQKALCLISMFILSHVLGNKFWNF